MTDTLSRQHPRLFKFTHATEGRVLSRISPFECLAGFQATLYWQCPDELKFNSLRTTVRQIAPRVWRSSAQRVNIKVATNIHARECNFITYHNRNITMDPNDHVLEKLSIEADSLSHGDLMARMEDGWSISNRLTDPVSIHYGYSPSDRDLEVPDRLLSVVGPKWCGFSQERAERMFNEIFEYRTDAGPR